MFRQFFILVKDDAILLQLFSIVEKIIHEYGKIVQQTQQNACLNSIYKVLNTETAVG